MHAQASIAYVQNQWKGMTTVELKRSIPQFSKTWKLSFLLITHVLQDMRYKLFSPFFLKRRVVGLKDLGAVEHNFLLIIIIMFILPWNFLSLLLLKEQKYLSAFFVVTNFHYRKTKFIFYNSCEEFAFLSNFIIFLLYQTQNIFQRLLNWHHHI